MRLFLHDVLVPVISHLFFMKNSWLATVFFQAGKDDDMLEECEGSDEAMGYTYGIVDRCGMVSS